MIRTRDAQSPRALHLATLTVASILTVASVDATFAFNYAPPPALAIESVTYRDLDGDGDGFPDTGETGRLVLRLKNTGAETLSNVTVILTSSDVNVACLPEWSMAVGTLSPQQVVTAGSLAPGLPGFTFKASDTLQSVSPTNPARIGLCLRYTASGYGGFSEPVCFSLVADLDLPGGSVQTFIPGNDGIAGTPDDGALFETFDVDRDGDGTISVNDTFRTLDRGAFVSGSYQRGAAASSPTTIASVLCGGFLTPTEGNALCTLDPDFPMDWHLHCPPGGNCSNAASGPCVGGCSFSNNVPKALTAPNSLHMGAHFLTTSNNGDTTHFRALQAFVTPPLNMAVQPRPGDLQLSMFQIVDLMDDHGTGGAHTAHQCFDCADVQIQVDTDPDPANDAWGFWDKLVPYQNVYDHTPMIWSAFTVNNYCVFTPGDTGTAPPAPRGVHETMCFMQGAWSHCGSVRATAPASTGDCAGPGTLDPSNNGVWVETRFDLSSYIGQRIRIRWLGSSWGFDSTGDSYYEAGTAWQSNQFDDGWWLDNIGITGLITAQTPPLVDSDPPPGGTCPAPICADLDGDGYAGTGVPPCPAGVPLDCDDGNPATYSDANEIYDGLDNQCPGNNGYGLIDEINFAFFHLGQTGPGSIEFCYEEQAGPTAYQIAVSDAKDFSTNCTAQTVPPNFNGCTPEPNNPPVGKAFYYLVRPASPHVGDWGANSAGQKISRICGL
jgi:hypothetical protein